MLVQNWYQAQRAYVRKALEKQKAIDVNSSETLVEKPTNLILLIPLLFLVYIFELVLSLLFLYYFIYPNTPVVHQLESLPKLVISTCFFILSLGNTITTISILLSKQQQRGIYRLRRQTLPTEK